MFPLCMHLVIYNYTENPRMVIYQVCSVPGVLSQREDPWEVLKEEPSARQEEGLIKKEY